MPTEETKSRGAAASVTVRPFQIRGRFLTAFAFRVESTELDAAFYEALDAQLVHGLGVPSVKSLEVLALRI